MNWSWGEEGEYDEEPSVDYMEYLARRASCSVLPDPPKAMVYLYNGCCCCMLLTFFTQVETQHTRERDIYILSPQCIIVHDNDCNKNNGMLFGFAQVAPAPVPKRKKSLPGAADAPAAILSREEASVLSSQRREEVRRQVEEAERYRANPLLYFCSPQVKVRSISQCVTHPAIFVHSRFSQSNNRTSHPPGRKGFASAVETCTLTHRILCAHRSNMSTRN